MREDLSREDAVALMSKLRQHILEDPGKALVLIEQLEKEERFESDPSFWCAVMVEKVSAFTYLGEYELIYPVIQEVYNRTMALGDKKIFLEASARLGAAYSKIGNLEKAIKLLQDVPEIELSIGEITLLSPTAYNNLATVYAEHDKYQQAKFCYEKAYQIFKNNWNLTKSRDALVLYSCILSNLCLVAKEEENLEAFHLYSEEFKSIPEEDRPASILCLYDQLEILYCELKHDYEGAIKIIFHNLEHAGDEYSLLNKCGYLLDFYKIAERAGLEEEYVVKKLDHYLSSFSESEATQCVLELYEAVLNYAVKVGDTKMMAQYYSNISAILNRNEEREDFNKCLSLDILLEIAENRKNKDLILQENETINRLTEESLAKSKQIKRLYDQSRIITRLGQKITAKSSLSSIEQTIFNEFSILIPLDYMGLYIKSFANKFISPHVYSGDKVLDSHAVYIEEDDLLPLMTISDGQHRSMGKLYKDEFCRVEDERNEDELYASQIFYPIKYKEDVVAVLLIKSLNRNAYKKHHINLIESVAPYIAIEIVNWNRATVLSEKNEMLESDKKKLQSLVEYHRTLSNMDQLTKISNRRDFDLKLKSMIKDTVKKKTMLHLLMFDIDNFKIYNDRNGHIKGDEALVSVVRLVLSLINPENTVFARYGGEEFMLVQIGTTRQEALEMAKKICEGVQKLQIKYNDGTDNDLSVSLGLVSVNYKSMLEEDTLIKAVDDCLYEAKNTGKNKIVSRVVKANTRGQR